jgi:transposase
LKDGTLRIDKQAAVKAEKYDGKYLIRTFDDTLSTEDVAVGHKQLVDIKQDFRTLKSTLELHSMYHRLEDCIQAHVLLSWPALLLVRIVEIHTHESWLKVRDEHDHLMLGHFSSKNGDLYQRPN